MTTDPISADEARWMLGYFGLDGGEKPGGFRMSLIETITKADPENKARLRLGFPGLVAAFDQQMDVAGLQAIALGGGEQGSTYTCLRCGAVSHHPDDLANLYCGMCHQFATDEAAIARLSSITAIPPKDTKR